MVQRNLFFLEKKRITILLVEWFDYEKY